MSELLIVADTSHYDIVIEPFPNLSRPYTLVEGEHYIYIDRYCAEAKMVLLDVKFIGYTSCPAIVMVIDDSGQKVRVPRGDLRSSDNLQNMINHINQVDATWNNR